MRLPPNYGQRYTTAFEVFPRVAQDTGAALVPFMLEGVGGVASMMQADGIHLEEVRRRLYYWLLIYRRQLNFLTHC